MTKEVAILELFKDLREHGLTKYFEEYSRLFVTGIVSTAGDVIEKDDFDKMIETVDFGLLPNELCTFLKSIVCSGDILRYHMIIISGIVIHYVFIKNNEIGTRLDKFDHPAAVSSIIINHEYDSVQVSGANTKDTTDEETSVPDTHNYMMYAGIVFGEKCADVSDRTRGPIIKHELAHIIIEYVACILSPGLFDKYKEDLSDEEISNFVEFLCDFVQFDSLVINKVTVNPIARFVDAMPLLFKEPVVEKYSDYVKVISPFYNMFD